MGSHEIRIRFGGISRQRIYQLTDRRDFPAPVAQLACGRVWLAEDVEGWAVVHRPDQADLDADEGGERGPSFPRGHRQIVGD